MFKILVYLCLRLLQLRLPSPGKNYSITFLQGYFCVHCNITNILMYLCTFYLGSEGGQLTVWKISTGQMLR